MRKQTRQKLRERFLLERFIDAMGLVANIEEEREAPDFLIRIDGQLIGVEVSEVFISHAPGKSPQAQESISDRIVARARQHYDECGGAPAHVSICFYPGADLRGLNRNRTAETLAKFVCSLQLSPWQRSEYRPEEVNGPLPDQIAFIHALGVPSAEMAHWAVARAGWAAPLTMKILLDRVEEKAKRLSAYQAVVPENWLLLIADRTKPSQLFDLNAELDASAVATPFSRAFFYGYPEKRVLQLGSRNHDAQPFIPPDLREK